MRQVGHLQELYRDVGQQNIKFCLPSGPFPYDFSDFFVINFLVSIFLYKVTLIIWCEAQRLQTTALYQLFHASFFTFP
jgi:hypothetical protein